MGHKWPPCSHCAGLAVQVSGSSLPFSSCLHDAEHTPSSSLLLHPASSEAGKASPLLRGRTCTGAPTRDRMLESSVSCCCQAQGQASSRSACSPEPATPLPAALLAAAALPACAEERFNSCWMPPASAGCFGRLSMAASLAPWTGPLTYKGAHRTHLVEVSQSLVLHCSGVQPRAQHLQRLRLCAAGRGQSGSPSLLAGPAPQTASPARQ